MALAALATASLYAATLLQLTHGIPGDAWSAGVAGGAFVAAFVILGRTSFTFTWQGHRHRMVLDEVAVYVGFVLLPATLVIVLVAIASAFEQVMMGRERLKAIFNLSQSVLGAALGGLAAMALLAFGVDPVLAALPSAFLYPLGSNFLSAGVFSRLGGTGQARLFVGRFLAPGLVAGAVGAGGGVAVTILYTVHPLTLLSLVPFLFLTYRYGVLSAQVDRELEVRKRLAEVGRELVGSADEERSALRILDVCGDVLPSCGRAEIHLHGRAAPYARDFGPGATDGSDPLEEPILGTAREGDAPRAVGVLRIHPRPASDAITEGERELLRLVASQAGAALEGTQALAREASARARMEAYLGHAADAILLVAEGRVQYANPAAHQLFGLAPGAPARVEQLFDEPAMLAPAANGPLLAESTARDLAGARRMSVEVHAAPLAPQGRVEGVLLLVRDVTERKRLEEETHRQREVLARQEKLSAIGTLVAGVAHEINNPVTYMRGAIELARLDIEDAGAAADASPAARDALQHAAKSLDKLGQGVDRVERITHSLKAVARQGSGERSVEDAQVLAQEVANVLGVGLPASVRLETDLRAAPVHVNPGEIHQVVLNLVKNAVEALAAADGGAIRLSTRTDGAMSLIVVEDDGPGIPADVQKRLFEPFFTTKRKGTGLGLSLSKGLVEAHGGELILDSALGRGTRFVVRLPRAG